MGPKSLAINIIVFMIVIVVINAIHLDINISTDFYSSMYLWRAQIYEVIGKKILL